MPKQWACQFWKLLHHRRLVTSFTYSTERAILKDGLKIRGSQAQAQLPVGETYGRGRLTRTQESLCGEGKRRPRKSARHLVKRLGPVRAHHISCLCFPARFMNNHTDDIRTSINHGTSGLIPSLQGFKGSPSEQTASEQRNMPDSRSSRSGVGKGQYPRAEMARIIILAVRS